MAKIEFDDPYYSHDQKRKKVSFGRIIAGLFLTLTIFIAGAIGGVGGVILLSSKNGDIAKKIGLSNFKDLAIPTTSTQRIVVEESNAIIDTVNKVAPSVVSITLKKNIQVLGGTYQTEGAGTGFIITSDGLILTNKHVADSANAAYTVITADGKTYDATVKSLDPSNDLAVLKIDARNLPVVELGDSDQLKIGQWVVAVGNALGQFSNTVTTGVISGKGRKISASDSSGSTQETLSGLLQTDTAINPGNSGGPLVNLAGQVVGINTAVASNAQGIGFAIPINAAKSAIDSIKKTGRIIRPYLGVRYLEITPAIAKEANLSVDYGALIQRGSGLTDFAVVPGSPADKAGISENDIILDVNGQKIDEDHSLLGEIQKYNVGDTVTLKVLSKGSQKEVKVTLQESK